MPVHDWSKATPGEFHDFHVEFQSQVRRSLMTGVLPKGYYAAVEQHVMGFIPDVLTMRTREARPPVAPGDTLVLTRPRTRATLETGIDADYRANRVITVRSKAEHRLVAVIEIVSAANKSNRVGLATFVNKSIELIRRGVHLLVINLLPPGNLDRHGLHAVIWKGPSETPAPPPTKPLAVVSYEASSRVRAFVQELAAGDPFEDAPLFLEEDGCVELPLESIYTTAFAVMGEDVLDALNERS